MKNLSNAILGRRGSPGPCTFTRGREELPKEEEEERGGKGCGHGAGVKADSLGSRFDNQSLKPECILLPHASRSWVTSHGKMF